MSATDPLTLVSSELAAYYRRVVGKRALELRPPSGAIRFYDGGAAIVLHREGQFQVELLLSPARIDVAEHRHPHVETIDVMLSGDVCAVREGVQHIWPKPPRPNGLAHDFMRIFSFPRDCLHAGSAGALPAATLSVQRWHGVVPGSVTTDLP